CPARDRTAVFRRRVTIDADEWQAVRLPLRYFAWNHPAVPTWEDVDRLVLQLDGGGTLLIDRVELTRGKEPRAAYLSPREIARIAFGNRAGTVRTFEQLPWVVFTDAPQLDGTRLLDALSHTYENITKWDFPSLQSRPPRRPVVLVVFATEDEFDSFWPRFKDLFGYREGVPK